MRSRQSLHGGPSAIEHHTLDIVSPGYYTHSSQVGEILGEHPHMSPIACRLRADCCPTNIRSLAVHRPRRAEADILSSGIRSSSGDRKAQSKGEWIGESNTRSIQVGAIGLC
jgi:hypothetical protein